VGNKWKNFISSENDFLRAFCLILNRLFKRNHFGIDLIRIASGSQGAIEKI